MIWYCIFRAENDSHISFRLPLAIHTVLVAIQTFDNPILDLKITFNIYLKPATRR